MAGINHEQQGWRGTAGSSVSSARVTEAYR
jgi:hypothetical protein